VRPVLAAVVLAALLAPAVADARGACPLVPDFAGDATAYGSALASDTNDAPLDLLGAGLASSARALTVVVHLAASPAATDTASPLGTAYLVQFTTPPLTRTTTRGEVDRWAVWAVVPAGVAPSGGWGSGHYGALTAKGAGTVRVTGSTVTATMPTGTFGRALVGNVGVTAFRLLAPPVPGGQPFSGVSVDRADTTRTYRGGTPGCV
jgi:hypothetical protein